MSQPESADSGRKIGRTALSVGPSPSRKPLRFRMKKSLRFGLILHKVEESGGAKEMSFAQLEWLTHLQQKLSFAELLKAIEFAQELRENPDLMSRHRLDLDETKIRTLPSPKRSPEVSRIGKGYADKGSLRPFHQRRTSPDEHIGLFPKWSTGAFRSRQTVNVASEIRENLSVSVARSLAWHFWSRSGKEGQPLWAQDFEKEWSFLLLKFQQHTVRPPP